MSGKKRKSRRLAQHPEISKKVAVRNKRFEKFVEKHFRTYQPHLLVGRI